MLGQTRGNYRSYSHILKEDYSPSFFQNSCPGNRHQDERDGVEITAQEESRPKNENEIEGWTKSLRYLPSINDIIINDIIIDKHLIEGSSTIPKTSTGPHTGIKNMVIDCGKRDMFAAFSLSQT